MNNDDLSLLNDRLSKKLTDSASHIKRKRSMERKERESDFIYRLIGIKFTSLFIILLILVLAIFIFYSASLSYNEAKQYEENATWKADELNKSANWQLFLGLLLTGGAILTYTINKDIENKRDATELEIDIAETRSIIRQEAIDLYKKIDPVPKNAKKVTHIKGLAPIDEYAKKNNLPTRSLYVWRENKDLLFTFDLQANLYFKDILWKFISSISYDDFLDKSGIKIGGEIDIKDFINTEDIINKPIFKIKECDFLFYSREGDFYVKTDVKGSGGGSDYGNAIVGGVLFGGAGAIVASRKEIKIDSTTTEVDKRKTILYYMFDNEIRDAHFDTDTYNLLKELFPQKDATVIDKLSKLKNDTVHIAQNNYPTNTSENKKVEEDDIFMKIEKLSGLKEKGAITEEEFIEKKKKLLDQL